MRSSNNKKDTLKEIETFKTKLLQRGYSEKDINPIITNALHKERKDCLRYKLKNKRAMPPLVLATKFNPSFNGLNKAIKKHWHLIEQNDSTKTMFPKPPIIAYKRHKNFKDLLTSSKL